MHNDITVAVVNPLFSVHGDIVSTDASTQTLRNGIRNNLIFGINQ